MREESKSILYVSKIPWDTLDFLHMVAAEIISRLSYERVERTRHRTGDICLNLKQLADHTHLDRNTEQPP